MNKVFVYGTLKRNQGNHKLLKNSTFIETCETLNVWGFVSLGPFPAMIENSDNPVIVQGELYDVDDDSLEMLDFLEGVPSLYTRKKIVINTKSMGEVVANTYILSLSEENLPQIKSGKW